MIELHTERLRLVALSVPPEQVPGLLGVVMSPGWPARDLRDMLPRYLSDLVADEGLLGFGPWVLVCNGEVVGDAGFLGRPDSRGTVELGYSILPHKRRRGYATEAAATLAAWALPQPGVARIVAACAPGNEPSIRVLEKVGFARAGERAGELLWELTP